MRRERGIGTLRQLPPHPPCLTTRRPLAATTATITAGGHTTNGSTSTITVPSLRLCVCNLPVNQCCNPHVPAARRAFDTNLGSHSPYLTAMCSENGYTANTATDSPEYHRRTISTTTNTSGMRVADYRREQIAHK
ncbi:hypothetical protein CBL_14017 [Carabus blaptoides fortunei]